MAYLVVGSLSEFGDAEEFNRICIRVGWYGRKETPFDYFVEQFRVLEKNLDLPFIFTTLPPNLNFPCFREVHAVIELHDPEIVRLYYFLQAHEFKKPLAILKEEKFRAHFLIKNIQACIELGKKLKQAKANPFTSRPFYFLNDRDPTFKGVFIFDPLIAQYHGLIHAPVSGIIYEDVLFARIAWCLADCYARDTKEVEKSKFNGKIPYVVTEDGRKYYKGHKISIYGVVLKYLMENGGNVGESGVKISDYDINEMLVAIRKLGGFFEKTKGEDIISSLAEMLIKDSFITSKT